MRVLVTGGAGYIGSVAVEQLIRAGDSVVVFDNLSQGHREAIHPQADFVEGDLAEPAVINAVFRDHKTAVFSEPASVHLGVRSSIQ